MFAVIKTGGKQYKVASDEIIEVEKILGDAGTAIEFDQVLAVGDGDDRTIGSPHVEGAGVRATIVEQRQGDKIVVFKKQRRQNYRRKKGHRQDLTMVRINEIVPAGFAKGTAKPAKTDRRPVAADDATDATVATAADTPEKNTPAEKPAAKKQTAKKPAAMSTATGKDAE